ncbi:MAG: hypothetical protein ACM3NS_08405, partial [Deltaproteobacteria bacterium]
PSDAVRAALALLAAPIRQRMAELRRSRWLGAHATPAVHRLVSRLQTLARSAARRRDAATLERLHHAIRFAGGGHTAGERAWIACLVASSDRAVASALPRFPEPTAEWDALDARLTGLIVFGPGGDFERWR